MEEKRGRQEQAGPRAERSKRHHYSLPPGIPHTLEKGALQQQSPGRFSWENTTSLKQKQTKKHTSRSHHLVAYIIKS